MVLRKTKNLFIRLWLTKIQIFFCTVFFFCKFFVRKSHISENSIPFKKLKNFGTMQFAPNTRFQLKHFYFAFLCFEYYCLCIFTVGKINFISFFSMNIFTLPTTEQTRSYFVALNYMPLCYSGEAVGLCTTMEPGSKPSSGKKFLLKKFFLIESKAGQRVNIPCCCWGLSAYCDLRAPGAAGEFQPIVTLCCRSKGGNKI